MSSSFETLTLDRCERCGLRRELLEKELRGGTYEICRRCAHAIQLPGGAKR